MSNISFFEYCADFLDLHADILTEEQKNEAYNSYDAMLRKLELEEIMMVDILVMKISFVIIKLEIPIMK